MSAPNTPEWVKDAVFYQIFPDRFAKSEKVPKPKGIDPWGAKPTVHGYQGGDLVGVVEKLAYLQDLGVDALYFTPIFQSASNHRYHTHNYEQVDPMLGGNEALRLLIDEAHAKGMKIVLDGVFNHASRGFFQFHDILENGSKSAYLDWFHVQGFPLRAYDETGPPNYGAWWGLKALPKFNVKTTAVRRYLLGIARKWIDFGIDGWRLDVANEIDDDDFWREFRRLVREGNPHAYIVGEVWTDSRRWLQGDMWDAVTNYIFTHACISFFIGKDVDTAELKRTSLYPAGRTGAEAFRKYIDALLNLYHPNVNSVQLNPLDSHDTARFATFARGDFSALKLASLFQFTFVGAPVIYYGDEIGMTGAHDPANRGAMIWDESRWNRDLLDHFRRLIRLRREHPALRRGSYESLLAQDSVHVHLRRFDEDVVVVALNVSRESRTIDVRLPDGLRRDTVFSEVWTGEKIAAVQGVLNRISIPGRGGRVFEST